MQAVINISSEGTRLRPLSCTKPAGLITMGDKYLIQRLIENLKKHSVTEVVIITGYMGDEVEKSLGNDYDGIKIQYAKTDFEDGGLKTHGDVLAKEFLYFSKLIYSEADFSRLVKFHHQRGAYATILVAKNSGNRISIGGDCRINRIEEKRLWNSITGDEKGAGVYMLSRDIIRFIPEDMSTDLFENVFPSLVRAGKSIYAMSTSETVISVEDIPSFMRAGFSFLECLKKKRAKGIMVSEGAIVEKGALLEAPCYIGKNAHIHKGAKVGAYSHIGEGTVVKEGASLKRSIVLKGCRIGKNVSLRGCIADEGVIIGDNTTVLEQAVIGKSTKIGEAVTVRSFVKIWPEKTLEDCITVSENVLWGQKKRTRLYKKGVIEGVINADITPRFCTMLGECAGAGFDGGEIGVATDGSAAGIMVRDAVVAGLLGMGCRVKDFGEQPLPITRRGVLFYMLKGAISISVVEKDGEDVAMIDIIGSDGAEVGETVRGRMEDYFEKGDFLYPESKKITESEYLFEYKIHYLKSLVGYTDKKRKPLKILLACPAIWGRRLISSAMADFGCSISMYMPYEVISVAQKKAFEQSVDLGGFDIGFVIDAKCEKLTVVLPKRRTLDDEAYMALTCLVIMKKHKGATIHVPLTASSAIDMLAEKHGCEIVREPLVPDDSIKGKEIVSDEYIFRYDAVGSVIKLVDYFAREDIETLINQIPPITIAKTVIEIPKGEIEKVMGKIKHLSRNNAESSEGVKITLDKGWVVVMPDGNKEVCHVVGESTNYETARELCDFCIDEILK